MSTTFLVFCVAYSIITIFNIVRFLKSGTGYDAFIAVGYMISVVWAVIAAATGLTKAGAMWYIAIYNILILLTLIIGAVGTKKLAHPSIIFSILLKLVVIAFAIGLAI